MKKIDIKTLNAYVEANTRFCREYHDSADLIIYGYDYRQSDNQIVWNDFNKIMRGIVVNSLGEIKAQPFNKFFTFKEYVSDNQIMCSEGQILSLPNSDFIIKEKVDGSMGLLYWVDETPFIATQRSFANPNAQKANNLLHNKYKDSLKYLNPEYSYVFEVIFPETNVLVDYGKEEKLVLLGVVDHNSGKEIPIDNLEIGFPKAKDYTKEYGHISSLEELQKLNIPNLEGFVITYPDSGLKIKVKFDWYERAHKLINSILMMERATYNKMVELKELLGWEKKNLQLTECSEEELSQYYDWINNPIPGFFSQNGIEQWLNGQKNNQSLMRFNLDSQMKRPLTYTPMWNLMKRLKNSYI